MKKIIGILLVIFGALLIRGVDWIHPTAPIAGIGLVIIGLWLALTKNKVEDESKWVGGSDTPNHHDMNHVDDD